MLECARLRTSFCFVVFLPLMATVGFGAEGKDNPIPTPVWPAVKRLSPSAVAAKLDQLIETRLAREKIPASDSADDAEFLRRIHLDLIGRIPTPERAAAFLDSKARDKRAKLIDELLADPEYGKHFGNVWHDLVIPRTPISERINPEALRAAFVECFNNNLPWHEVVGRVVMCQGDDRDKNFLAFYQVNGDMGGKPMANVVARSFTRLFLGVRMECAECHDDPYKPWKRALPRAVSRRRVPGPTHSREAGRVAAEFG